MTSLRRVIAELFEPGFLIGGIALGGVAVSGAIAAAMSGLFGSSFVTGDLPDIRYTAARCAELFQYATGTTSCEAAAVSHHLDEVVSYRLATGLLGLLALGVWYAGRRTGRWPRRTVLPDRFTSTVATTGFTLAGGVLALDALNRFVQSPNAGAGASLSGAIVCVGLAVAFGTAFLRATPTPEPSGDVQPAVIPHGPSDLLLDADH